MVAHYSFPVDYFDTEIIPKAVLRYAVFPGGIKCREKSNLKFCHFWPNCLYSPLKIISFLNSRQKLIETLSIESLDLKTSFGTNFRCPKDKEIAKRRKNLGLRQNKWLLIILSQLIILTQKSFPRQFYDTPCFLEA